VYQSIVVGTDGSDTAKKAVLEAVDLAKQLEADLIVVGNAGMHGLRGHLASVPNTVAHKAECAVLLVPTS
jgi:nucleotide-binding universal stress UspA family protein